MLASRVDGSLLLPQRHSAVAQLRDLAALLLFVRLSSERVLQAVRQHCSFPSQEAGVSPCARARRGMKIVLGELLSGLDRTVG